MIGTALAIGLGLASVGGSLGGAAIASSGANKAANTQAGAANYAAQLEKQSADAALAEQRRQFDITQGNLAPWLTTGRSGLANLGYLMGLINPSTPGTAQTAAPQIGAGSTLPPTFIPPAGVNITGLNKYKLLDANGGDYMPWQEQGGYPAQQAAQTRTEAQPGQVDLGSLVNPNIGSFGQLSKTFDEKFAAPTGLTEQNDPGFQARLNLGQQIMERSAAARGGALSGGTLKDLNQFAQDYASSEYGNTYNRAWNEYAGRYNVFKQNQADIFNRYAAMSGVGQTAASTLGTLGSNNANAIANILMTSGAQQAQQVGNAAAARGTGYLNSGNIWGNAIGGSANSLSNLLLMSKLLQPSGGGGSLPVNTYDPVTGTYPS